VRIEVSNDEVRWHLIREEGGIGAMPKPIVAFYLSWYGL